MQNLLGGYFCRRYWRAHLQVFVQLNDLLLSSAQLLHPSTSRAAAKSLLCFAMCVYAPIMAPRQQKVGNPPGSLCPGFCLISLGSTLPIVPYLPEWVGQIS